MKIQPPGWSEPVTYPRYVWEELWMYGGRNGGYAESNRAIGALKMMRACLPHISIDRGEDVSFYEFVAFSCPTRTCDEAELWTLGVEFTRYHGLPFQRSLVKWKRGPD